MKVKLKKFCFSANKLEGQESQIILDIIDGYVIINFCTG
jgi:hypothetical protein